MKSPRLVPTMTYGAVLQTLTLILGLGGGVWAMSKSQAAVEAEVASARRRLDILAPKVEALTTSTPIQDERIGSLAEAMRDQRKLSSEILVQLGAIREGMAGIQATIQRDGAPPVRIPVQPNNR